MNQVYPFIMVIAGLMIPVMASLNSALALHIGSVSGSVALILGAAFVCSLLQMTVHDGYSSIQSLFKLDVKSVQYLGAGLCLVFYLTCVSAIGPTLGIGGAVICVLLGQLVSILLIDHFGLFGMPRSPITWQRGVGLCLLLVGVCLILFNNERYPNE